MKSLTVDKWLATLIFSLAFNLEAMTYVWNMPNDLRNYFAPYFNSGFDPINESELQQKLDFINRELFNLGYFSAEMQADRKGDLIVFTLTNSFRSNFNFIGHSYFSKQELKNKVYEKIKNDLGKVDVEAIKNYLIEAYEDSGIYGTKIELRKFSGFDKSKSLTTNYHLQFFEGKKVVLSKINFRGNKFFNSSQLQELYDENSLFLSSQFLDKKFAEKFPATLKRKYFENGFVQAEVSKPKITIEEDGRAELTYTIYERSQFIIDNIIVDGVESGEQDILKSLFKLKIGEPINVLNIETDLKELIAYYQDKGFYFISLTNLNSDKLLQYQFDKEKVTFNPAISKGDRYCVRDMILSGHVVTKNDVVKREFITLQGDLLTPIKLNQFKSKLSALNLFSDISITPTISNEKNTIMNCVQADLYVQVKEKDFGTIELVPGFRTDLGLKLGAGVTYNNLLGQNRSLSLKTQVNQRINQDNLDLRRRTENRKLLEYSAKASYSEPYLFYDILNSQLEFETSSSFLRKRFSTFDADILRVSPQLSKNVTRVFTTALRYQLEFIRQFDASTQSDNDNYAIGSMTPSVTFDFRDDSINPRRGAFFNLSSEWANHFFGSQKKSTFEVNYIKVISRNKFYFPFKDMVLATSLAFGFQKNYAINGNIPNIKVFRLDGYDEIRGYEETEMNRLKNGEIIGTSPVSNRAYFVSFKFEPRYSLSDHLVLAVFFDAGRLFVNSLNPLDLRSSGGVGVKYMTPVGSLDFDYGFKFSRKTYPSGERDSFGKFQLSIGFF